MQATLNGSPLSVTLGTVVDYRTPWSAVGTASAGDVVSILYWPIYRVKWTNEKPSFAKPAVSGWSLVLEEA